MRKGIYLLPNCLTLCGMFAGFYSILSVLSGNYVTAAWAIVVAGVFDGLDGWVARLTNTGSKFGVQMDSLSDAIAFGVAPAVMLYAWSLSSFGRAGAAVAFLFVACGVLRLARYNVQKDVEEKKSFTGLPIPAAAGVAISTVLFFTEMGYSPTGTLYVPMVIFLSALLMVSTLRFHSIKELNLNRRKPFTVLVIIVMVLTLFFMHPEATLFAIGITYLAGGLAENAYLYIRKHRTALKVKTKSP